MIEGGGSTCRGLIYDLTQNRVKGPLILHSHPCNLHRDRDLTLRNIKIMLETLDVTGGAASGPLTLCLPGMSNAENVMWLKAALHNTGYDTIHMATDAIAALLGAFPTHEDGQGILIGGTGSIALGYAGNQLWRVGTSETEKACGPWIARQAWEQSKHDPELNRIFGSGEDLTHAPHHVIAGYTPGVFQAARAGNRRAEDILQEAAESAAAFMTQLQQVGVKRFALCGSVARALQTRIPLPTENPQGDGVDGALRLALSVYKNPQALSLFTNIRRIEDEEQGQRAAGQ